MQDCSGKCWHTCKPRNGVSADWTRRQIVSSPEALTHRILHSLKLQSIDLVDNLQILREIVVALEAAAQGNTMKQ